MQFIKKNLLALVLCLSMFNAISAQVQPKKIGLQKIEFLSVTRGYQESITVKKNKVTLKKSGIETLEKDFKIKPKDFQQLRYIVQQIDLKKINTLVAPSDNSKTDAAHQSHFTFYTHKGKYDSSVFDNYNSPKELQPLMQKIKNLCKL
jgi:hypothetical protein